MNMQNDILRLLTSKVEKNQWLCLFIGLAVGMITHIYMLTNKLPNWDDIANFGAFGVGGENGRWMISKIYAWGSDWSTPALNGMLAIILLSVSACFILAALELKTTTSAILLPVIMLTFPGVAGTMTFMFTVHIYAVGILFSCLGAWLIRRFRYGIIPGIALLVLSLAVYQSYICLTAGILVLALVMELFRKKEIKGIVTKGITSLVGLGGAMGLYLLITKTNFDYLYDYKGISTMGQINLPELPRLIGRAYKRILEYFVIRPWSFVSDLGQVLNIIVVISLILCFFFLVWKLEINKERARLVLACVLVFLLPLALSAIYVIAPQANATVLTLYQYFMVYVVLMGFLELLMSNSAIVAQRFSWIRSIAGALLMVLILLVGYDNYVLTNSAYFRMDIAFTRIHSFYERLYIRVTEQEGYSYGDSIVILGDWWPERNILSSYGMDIERYDEFEGVAMENGLFTTGVRQDFMRIYLGIDSPQVSGEKMDELMKTEEFANMPDYPAAGCVQKIDGIWVVRVAD